MQLRRENNNCRDVAIDVSGWRAENVQSDAQ